MSDSEREADDQTDRLEAIRERKRAELAAAADGEADADGDTAAGTPDEPVHVEGQEHLAELTATHDVVLVDFYADWCGPCRQLEPVVEALAADTAAAVAKVDIDRHQGLAQHHGVRGVPTLLLFADGEPVERVVGVRGQDQLAGLIEQYA